MLRAASPEDLPAIRQLLASSNDAPYDAVPVAEEKCFGRGFDGAPATFVTADCDAVAVVCGRFLRLLCVRRDRRRQGLGSAIVRELKPEVIAAEPGNYFLPGVTEQDAGFFRRLGFRPGAETWNLHVQLSGAAPAAAAPLPRPGAPPELLAFVRAQFGPIWAFEAFRAASSVYIEGIGFAVIEANNRGLGTFGPTGVADSMRGRGFGRELLRAALAELRTLGYERAIIPWTAALDFYGKVCGAEAAHRFVTYTSRP